MIGTGTTLDALKRDRPEWQPWLAVVEEVVREMPGDRWDHAVPAVAERRDPLAALIADATIAVQSRLVRRLLERMLAALKRRPPQDDCDIVGLFAASLRHDERLVTQIATAAGIELEAFQSVAALLPVPLLHAGRRRLASRVPVSWVEGYCPLCASWPVFAEVLGIERSRQFRCGRCGSAWHARQLVCAFCGTADHNELVTMVPEEPGSPASIEGCKRCRCYIKTFTRLQGGSPETVMVDDLATVDLDMAALELGYTRPSGAGRSFAVSVRDAGPSRLLRWPR